LNRVKQRESGLTDHDALTKWRAAHAEALTSAQHLRAAIAVFRRYAGELKYHPQSGVEGHIGQDLLDAAARLRELLNALSGLTTRWDEETSWLRTCDAQMPIEEIQQGHAAAREAARLTRAAMQIFEQAVLHPETAALDAPYGHSAPRRVHPGAQCTWVAERAEGLATELSSVTLRKETLLLAWQTS
jgi:hypothetical protein